MRLLLHVIVVLAAVASTHAATADIDIHRLQLQNGIRVVIVHVPDAPRQTIFTFLPLTLANDDANCAQWSHLLEHMLIRSTDPIGLNAEGIQFNGETTHTCLRMETFCEPDKWTQSLDRHVKWITNREFDAGILEREKDTIEMEEQATAQRGYSTKFALAAWNQAFNHGARHAAVHGDVAQATTEHVREYAQRRIPIDRSITIATIGPMEMEKARADLAAKFGAITPNAAQPHALSDEQWQDGQAFEATWDLPTRHAMWFWRLPDRQPSTLAAATVIAQSIGTFFHTEVELRGMVRQAMAYPFIDSPHGPILLIDCCLADESTAAQVWARLKPMIDEMAEGKARGGMIGWLAPMLARQVDVAPDFAALRVQLQPAMKVNTEGVWLLSIMNYEYSWGVPAKVGQDSLVNLDAAAVKSVMEALLNREPCALTLEPKAP